MHIHAHIVSDLSPFCVQFTASQSKTEEWRVLFLGVVVFTFPQKTSTGPTVKKRSAKGTYQGYVSRHSQCSGHCATPCPSLGHTPWLMVEKRQGFFLRHSEALNPGFFWEISKNLQLVPGKKKQKSVFLYVYNYIYTCICEFCYIVYRILKITQVVKGPEMMILFAKGKKTLAFPLNPGCSVQ